MPLAPPRFAGRLIGLCLFLALPVYGLSGLLVELLGSKHFHVPAVSAGADAHGHGHDSLERHHHGHARPHAHGEDHGHHHGHDQPDTAGIVAIDGDGLAGDAGSTPAGSAALVLATAAGMETHGAEPAEGGWPALVPSPLKRLGGERLERPPRR
jgi:hypothetical protein